MQINGKLLNARLFTSVKVEQRQVSHFIEKMVVLDFHLQISLYLYLGAPLNYGGQGDPPVLTITRSTSSKPGGRRDQLDGHHMCVRVDVTTTITLEQSPIQVLTKLNVA